MSYGIHPNAPRIRGKVGQCNEPDQPDIHNKWFFEISIWTFDGETRVGEPIQVGPFDTEAIAGQEMQRAVKMTCELAEKQAGQEPSGKYFDLKNGGIMRPWTEQ